MSVVWAFCLGFGGNIAVEVLAAIRGYYPSANAAAAPLPLSRNPILCLKM